MASPRIFEYGGASVQLDCPFCDKPYTFVRGEVCVCPSCNSEIAPPDEPAPRIESSRKRALVAGGFLLLGLVCLFLFNPYGAVVGMALIFGFIFVAAKLHDRCGNCGAPIQNRFRKWCPTCGADLKSFVE